MSGWAELNQPGIHHPAPKGTAAQNADDIKFINFISIYSLLRHSFSRGIVFHYRCSCEHHLDDGLK